VRGFVDILCRDVAIARAKLKLKTHNRGAGHVNQYPPTAIVRHATLSGRSRVA